MNAHPPGTPPRSTRLATRTFPLAVAGLLAAEAALAAGDGHGAALLPVLAALVVILLGAKLGGALFERLRQPPVLGELLAGVVLGNLGLAGIHTFDALRHDASIDLLAQIGVLFLLFEVGLESDLGKMLAVGRSSMLVAVLGVAAPMALGFFGSRLLLPEHDVLTHVFVGATLCATSVGISARVLSDMNRTASVEGRIILGAAVIDDVLGLIVLAVVAGVIEAADRGQSFQPVMMAGIVARALGFLVVAVVAGRWLSRRAFLAASRLEVQGLLLPLALAFCFLLAWLAGLAGLAPIVGAFAAGLVLDEVHVRELRARDPRGRSVEELLQPLSSFLVPVFFVLMGTRVDLGALARLEVVLFALALTVAAVLGKQLCSLGVLEKGADRIAVGIGMIPRGEVGLIFAGIGASLRFRGERVVDDAVYSAVVIVVALTTLLTPPLLAWKLRGGPAARRAPAPPA